MGGQQVPRCNGMELRFPACCTDVEADSSRLKVLVLLIQSCWRRLTSRNLQGQHRRVREVFVGVRRTFCSRLQSGVRLGFRLDGAKEVLLTGILSQLFIGLQIEAMAIFHARKNLLTRCSWAAHERLSLTSERPSPEGYFRVVGDLYFRVIFVVQLD